MTERSWVILFSLLCLLSGVLALVSWVGGDDQLARLFIAAGGANSIALAGTIHQATKEGR